MHPNPIIMVSASKPRTAAERELAWNELIAEAERMDRRLEPIRSLFRVVAGWFARQTQTFRPAHA